jgi:hypothetical protein
VSTWWRTESSQVSTRPPSLIGAPGQTFRVVPTAVWAVENNLSLANLGWEDFVRHLDGDGVFRGF